MFEILGHSTNYKTGSIFKIDFAPSKRTHCHILVERLYRTRNFLQNVLSCYSGTTQDNEINDTPFESPVMKVGMAVSKRQPRPCECKSTTLSKIEFMPISVENFSVSKLESIAMFWGFLLRYITFP